MPNPGIEKQSKEYPYESPGNGLAQADHVGFAMENTQVQRQHCEHENVESNPKPNLVIHSRSFVRGGVM
jgi:hypothetical protein